MTPGADRAFTLDHVTGLYAWLRRHPGLVDGVPAILLTLGGVGTAFGAHLILGPVRAALILLVTPFLTVPLVFRRRYPVRAFAVATGAGAFQVIANVRLSPADLAIVILLYTLAAYTVPRTSLIGLGICLLGSATAVLRWGPRSYSQISHLTWLLIGSLMFAGPTLISWVIGDSVRYRRAYYANLEERAARLERERDTQAQMAAAAERARIARELHDVVAHNVSVMVVQADGAAYALDTEPGRAREALATIAATGRQALTEMRVLLGVLRRPGEPADDQPSRLAPVPGLDQIDELIEQTRVAGLPVLVSVEGEPARLPRGIALAAYRIIQESLTNVRKHAGPGALVTVRIRYTAEALELVISDDGMGAAAPSDGAGHGLTGMRERAAMYGGAVEARPRPGGGFQVLAKLSLSAIQAGAA